MAKKKALKDSSREGDENCEKKIPKPLIERKRRARINKSLCELENLLADLVSQLPNKKGGKVEKADVLDLAVATLKNLKASQELEASFQQGYAKCFQQVTQFLENNDADIAAAVVRRFEGQIRSGPGPSVACSVIKYTGDLSSSPSIVSLEDRPEQCVTPAIESMWRPW